jgi:hypothetical protein
MAHTFQKGFSIMFLLFSMFVSGQTAKASQDTATRNIRYYVVVNGESQSGSWNSDESPTIETLRSLYGDHFAWFRESGRDYIVTNTAVLAQLDKAMEPQRKVNAMQADVNHDQSLVNEMQAKVNEHQRDVRVSCAKCAPSLT